MTLMCILFAVLMLLVIFGMMCIAACVYDASTEIHKLGNTLDDIGWELRERGNNE